MEIQYKNSISVEDYNHLRASAGWQEIEESQALTGIRNSSLIISAVAGRTTVGRI